MPSPPLDARSRALRRSIVKAFAAGGRGHIGAALSLVEILRVLYDDVLRLRPKNPPNHAAAGRMMAFATR